MSLLLLLLLRSWSKNLKGTIGKMDRNDKTEKNDKTDRSGKMDRNGMNDTRVSSSDKFL